ncbi:MAG: hypothetical protein IRY88_14535 [Rubrobacteraceae bacterium]|nr:hypothetical protein [Rubrobacteraceae bacterium]
MEIPRNRGKNTTLLTSLHARGWDLPWPWKERPPPEVFETYVEHLLAPRCVLVKLWVMDNLGVRRPKRIRELIQHVAAIVNR